MNGQRIANHVCGRIGMDGRMGRRVDSQKSKLASYVFLIDGRKQSQSLVY